MNRFQTDECLNFFLDFTLSRASAETIEDFALFSLPAMSDSLLERYQACFFRSGLLAPPLQQI